MYAGSSSPNEAERELLLRAQQGDGAARDALACRLRPQALQLARSLVAGRDEAQDVAQEAMLRFFTRLDLVDPARPLVPWLRRIVHNRAIDHYRRRRVRLSESLDTDGWDAGVLEIRCSAPGPELKLERRELRRRVWSCLAALSPKQREILVLREYQDLSYREIAEALDIPIGTVMSRLHSARAALRQRLLARRRATGDDRSEKVEITLPGLGAEGLAPCAS